MRPKLLDLFCGQGGASAGYHAAGFDVFGVDIDNVMLDRYPYDCATADALTFLREHGADFDAIHASPPCLAHTAYRRRPGVAVDAVDLIGPTREALERCGRPWIIENVPGAPLRDPITLCGSMFGLEVRRHRLFEGSVPTKIPLCDHASQQGDFPQATNRANRRRTCEIGVYRILLDVQKRAIGGCEWMDLRGITKALPPAYTEFLGEHLRRAL